MYLEYITECSVGVNAPTKGVENRKFESCHSDNFKSISYYSIY